MLSVMAWDQLPMGDGEPFLAQLEQSVAGIKGAMNEPSES